MSELSELSKTLYVPLVGRIYILTYYPTMIADSKVPALKSSLPAEVERMRRGQSEYTMLASVVRLVNMNQRIRAFLADNPHGVVVSVGCRPETTLWHCDSGGALWFELDLPEVIEVREGLLASSQRRINLPGDILDYSWIDQIKEYGERPTIVTVSGVFYYSHEDEVIDSINHLAASHNVRVVFDSTLSIGVKMSQYYAKRTKNSFLMHFSIDDLRALIDALVEGARLIEHAPYYCDIDTRGAGLGTRVSMRTSDVLHMVAMNMTRVRQ